MSACAVISHKVCVTTLLLKALRFVHAHKPCCFVLFLFWRSAFKLYYFAVESHPLFIFAGLAPVDAYQSRMGGCGLITNGTKNQETHKPDALSFLVPLGINWLVGLHAHG